MNYPSVQYNGKDYHLIHRYTTDYCEIQDANYRFHYLLVHYSELCFKNQSPPRK